MRVAFRTGLIAAAASALCACAPTTTTQVTATDMRASQLIAAAATQVGRCYRAPRIPHGGKQIITKLRVRYGPDGSLAMLPQVVSQSGVTPDNNLYAGPMAQAAIASVMRCSPLPRPAELDAGYLSEFYLTFSPRAAA